MRAPRKNDKLPRTSLEQIFNDFAAMQQEETGPVQGPIRGFFKGGSFKGDIYRYIYICIYKDKYGPV